jgi:SAM-dependent methyltransferase
MSLYEDLALAYDELFPPNAAALDYLLGIYPGEGGVLDLGCATASLLLDLARKGIETWGLEPSQAMLAVAGHSLAASGLAAERLPRLARGGMLDAASAFPKGKLGLVLCLGNTLPHLSGLDELGAFLAGARGVLRPGGSLVLQLLNYRSVLGKVEIGSFAFPVLEGGGLSFRRAYRPRPDGKLDFLTELASAQGEVMRDETRLYPFALDELRPRLEAEGFEKPVLQASWAGPAGAFDPEHDAYLIVRARRPE